MDARKDPYDILGVKSTDTDGVIRSAFYSKVKNYHPDVNNGRGDSGALNDVLEAFRAIMRQRKMADEQKVLNCKHCKGTTKCVCASCSFIIVLKRSFFAGQCAFCVTNSR